MSNYLNNNNNIYYNMDDWGEIELNQIGSEDFWYLLDELCHDKSDFYNNRSII